MRNFLVDVNSNLKMLEYNLVLYSLNETPITELYNITNFNIKPFFIGIDEISFNIPTTRNESDGRIIRNEIYDLVDGEHYILLNNTKFFVINKINEKADNDGKTYKEVSAYSREFELSQKKVVDYKANSRMLYDRENTMLKDEESGLTIERGILNYIFNHITRAWSIGEVDERVVSISNKGISRALAFPNSSLIQVFQELQKTYNCIFKFDTVNQLVNIESALDYELDIEDITNSSQYKGLYISDENFIKNMSKNIEYDTIKTRLYLYGKDNVSIQDMHPMGQPYIDNFSAFKNTKFMTQELINELNAYELLIENASPSFAPLLSQLQNKNLELEELYNYDDTILEDKGLMALRRELSLAQTNIDTRVANLAIIKESMRSADGEDLSWLHDQAKTIQVELETFDAQKTKINLLISAKSDQIIAKEDEIKSVKNQMQEIRENLSIQTHLAPHLIKEMDKFIRTETYNDSNFTENNIAELYEAGKKNLIKISQPSIQFDVDVVDFLSTVECQHTWDKLVLGDIVLLENKSIGFSYYVRLVGYQHSPDSNSLKLQFSNTNSFDDATLWIKDLLDQMNTTTSTLDFNKYKWDKTENMQDKMSKMIDEKLEEARQGILNAVGQKHLFDDSGMWLYKEDQDGSINDEQIRAINNTIALTEDGWRTVGTAITPKGIVAENIYGKIGKFAKINAEQIEVGGWDGEKVEDSLKDYIDQQNSELSSSINELDDVVSSAFSDNYVTNIEANNISLASNSVIKEAGEVKNIAISLGVPTITIVTAIDNLNTEIDKYVGKSNYPILITSENRVDMTNAFASLESAIAQLYKAIDEKRDSNTKGYIDQQVGELDGAMSDLEDNIDRFGRDLMLTATEASTIKMDLERVTYESTDIISIATSLDITTEKNNYIASLATLTNYLDMHWLNATYPLEITQTQIENVTTHFKYLDDRKAKLINKISDVRTQSATVHQIILSNENQSIVTDSSGVVTTLTEVQSDIDVFRGITKIVATIGTPTLKNKDDNIITFGAITKSNPTSANSGIIKWSISNNTNISSEFGWIEIPIVAEGISYIKKLTWNKARAGQDGYTPIKGTDYFDGTDGQDGTSNYIWIKYSANANGNNFNDTPNTYIGVATTISPTAPTIASEYKWSKVVGTDGIIGEDGVDGQTSYLHIKYSNNGTSFTANSGETVGAWIGTYVDFIEEDSMIFSKYTWNKVKGEDGYTPTKGADYFDGKDGQDGESKYLWIKYSQNSNGSSPTDTPTDAKYMGVATTITNIKPTNYLSYSWSLIKGQDGNNGIKGETGPNGQTSYLHIKYSDNGTSFTANNGEIVGAYIGTYVDFVEADSTTFSKYVWNKVRGNDGYTPVKGTDYFDGVKGQDGQSSYIWIKYSAYLDGTSFGDTPNKYIGVATTTASTAPTLKTAYKWTKIEGTDGSNGIKGETGANGQTSYLHIKYSDNGTSFTANSGETVGTWIGSYVDFVEADSMTFSKYTWNKVVGDDGTPARLVRVTTSHSAFITKNTINPYLASSYEPALITITPDFQNCSYFKWEYSTNGENWTQITRTTTSTTLPYMNSGTRVLSVPKAWSVYSSNQSFVIFKITSNYGQYDLVTVPRLFDSAQLAEDALKQNFDYNKTVISEAQGIEVFDNYSRQVLQIGGIDTTGNAVKNSYGLKINHLTSPSGGFSFFDSKGLGRRYGDTDVYYLNNITTYSGSTVVGMKYVYVNYPTGAQWIDPFDKWSSKYRIDRYYIAECPPVTVYLPQSFRHRDVKFSLSLAGMVNMPSRGPITEKVNNVVTATDYYINMYQLDYAPKAVVDDGGSLRAGWIRESRPSYDSKTVLRIVEQNLTATIPYVKVEGFIEYGGGTLTGAYNASSSSYSDYRPIGYIAPTYDPVDFLLIAISD